MNEWGEKHIPFIFFVDYNMSKSYISKIEEINSDEILYQFGQITNYKGIEESKKSAILRKMEWKPSP